MREGVLVVYVDSNSWATQYTAMAEQYRNSINKELGEELVSSLRFTVSRKVADNRKLQRAYIDANLAYVKLILHGGDGAFLGRRFDVLGLDGTERELRALPQGERVRAIEHFVRDARLALAETDDALRATAQPITLVQAPQRGRSALVSA